FGGYGKDEVRVRLRQIEELLLPFHQARASDAACTHGNKRLNDVEAGLLAVCIRIDECENPVATELHMKDQKIERQQPGAEGVSEIAQAHASDVENAGRDAGTGDCRAEIRLCNDQSQEHTDGCSRW